MKLISDNKSIIVEIFSRKYSNNDDYWDGNWLLGRVSISTSNSKISYGLNLRAEDFYSFQEGLLNMKNGVSKSVEFKTMEEGIYLTGTMELSGNIQWACNFIINDENEKFQFQMKTENQSLDYLLSQVSELVKQYPTKGSFN